MNQRSRSPKVWLLILSASAAGSDALAQQQVGSGGSVQLEEIVITAAKRSSTVQETPISVTALSGDDIQQRGLTDITQIVESVPGLSMRSSGPGQTELEMRGMTSAGGNSSTVGFYLEDTPLSAPAAAQNGKVVIDPDLYDLNRVEVLRGPQGTLYGAGSMGGTIKLVPNAPDPKAFSTSEQVILGDTRGGSFNHGENAMVNLPLGTDTAALRIVGTQEHLSGWIDRIVIASPYFPTPQNSTTRGNVAAAPIGADYKGVNDEDLTSLRAALLWTPTDNLSITPSFLYQKITQGGLSLIDSNPGTNSNYQPFDVSEPFIDRIDIASLNFQYHLGAFDLSSTTSYWTREEELRQDGSEQIATVTGAPIYASEGGFGPTSPAVLEDDRSWQKSEELRLTSTGDTAFKWLLGYFYQDFESDWDVFAEMPDAGPLTGTTNAFTQTQPTKIIQNAVFGEVSYKFLPDLTGTAGLRRFTYDGTVHTGVSGFLSSSGGNDILHFVTSERDQGVTPKFDLSYQANKDLLVYTTASKGFRPGGGNQPIPTSGALGTRCAQNIQSLGVSSGSILAFSPDHVWSYEAGEKFRSGDGRITVNSAAYFENWSDVQQNVPLPCGFPYTGNLGDAHIYGGEIELDAVVAPGLLVMLNSGYSHARFVTNPVAATTTIGNRVQNVPDWMSSASIAYRHSISEGLDLVARVDNSYVGSRIDVTAQPNYLPSYDLTNIRAGMDGGNWTAAVFVNNVTNKTALLSNSPAVAVNIATFNRIAVNQPLTVGLDLSYRFGK
jgi:iron complex outermembrane recepter protein